MAKLVFFSKFRNFEQQLSRFRISYLFWCDLLLFYGGRKDDPSFLESGRFPPLMVGEDGSYFGKDDLFFFLCNRFPDWAAVRECLSIPLEAEKLIRGKICIYIMKRWFGSFV